MNNKKPIHPYPKPSVSGYGLLGNKVKIPEKEEGFVHPKRGRDVNLINQLGMDVKDVLHHELGHVFTNRERKEIMKGIKLEIDKAPVSDKDKKRLLDEANIKISEQLRHKKQREVFGDE